MTALRMAFLASAFLAVSGLSRAADERLPVPQPLAVVKTENLVKDLFKTDYAKTKPADRAALAQKLLKQAGETNDDPVARYVLYKEARDVAAKAGDAATAMKAAGELADAFKVDRGDSYMAIADVLVASTATASAARATTDAFIAAVEPLGQAQEWDAALKLLTATEALARKWVLNAQLAAVRPRIKQFELIRAEARKIQDMAAKLATNPDDPAACTAVGRFTAMVVGDWAAGLPLLAKGADTRLKDAAEKDLKAATGTDPDQMAAADAWYDLAAAAEPVAKIAIQLRASHWYEQALPTATGLAKAKAEKRMLELQPVIKAAGGGTAKLFARIQAAVKAGKVQDTEKRGGGTTPYRDLPAAGCLLIGLDVDYGSFAGKPTVKTVRPIYMNADGKRVLGPVFGAVTSGRMVRIEAKPGYAVGSINVQNGLGIDGLSLTFMEITSHGLNPKKAYTSEWHGHKDPNTAAHLGGDGTPIIGIYGAIPKTAKSTFNGLGAILLADGKR